MEDTLTVKKELNPKQRYFGCNLKIYLKKNDVYIYSIHENRFKLIKTNLLLEKFTSNGICLYCLDKCNKKILSIENFLIHLQRLEFKYRCKLIYTKNEEKTLPDLSRKELNLKTVLRQENIKLWCFRKKRYIQIEKNQVLPMFKIKESKCGYCLNVCNYSIRSRYHLFRHILQLERLHNKVLIKFVNNNKQPSLDKIIFEQKNLKEDLKKEIDLKNFKLIDLSNTNENLENSQISDKHFEMFPYLNKICNYNEKSSNNDLILYLVELLHKQDIYIKELEKKLSIF